MIDERLKSKDWRMSHLYNIIDKNAKVVVFKPNKAQQTFLNNKTNRDIILKARQQGFTTLACIDFLDTAIFKRNQNCVIIAHEQKAMESIFNKIRLAFELFNDDLKKAIGLEPNTDRANQISFNNGSTIKVALSSRAETVNRLHISEFGKICAKYPDKEREIISGAFPSVVPNGTITIESTAEGESGSFHDMFWEGWNNEPKTEKDFKSHFFSWSDHEEYRSSANIEIPEKYKEYQKSKNLSDDQITWYYLTSKDLKDLMKQEFPTTPEEAFEVSGFKMFTQESIEYQTQFIEEPRKIGEWEYYRDYISSHRYAVGADVAEGVGQDSSTIVVFDFTKSEVVATYSSNKIAPDMFAYELKKASELYGNCIIAPERNNHGHTTISKLKDLNGNMYTEEAIGKMGYSNPTRYGWHTTRVSKPKMMFELKDALDENEILVHSKKILHEIRTYDKMDLDKAIFDKEQTKHWDLLIALAIAFQMKTHSTNIKQTSNVLKEALTRTYAKKL